MFVIPVRADGGCLFTSLRLGMELYTVLKSCEKDPVELFLLDGDDDEMVYEGQRLRAKIVRWYEKHLSKEVSELGEYVQGGRIWRRVDLLALEMVRKGKDVPEKGKKRKEIAREYLEGMSDNREWGSTPEYSAFAFSCGFHVTVFQNNMEIINSVNDKAEKKLNLYYHNDHYQVLVTAKEMQILLEEYGSQFNHFTLISN